MFNLTFFRNKKLEHLIKGPESLLVGPKVSCEAMTGTVCLSHVSNVYI